ncbi:exonuclease domain-containing protein [Paenibacillus thermoaerophilus]|uniref:Exonuclease domain-containing protein n=1 Tax=Paenibacillus thermoaerophilus TaxID=1215385 RepID=A0ABW2V176_9BACL|nr:3'-5' exonuclease [Paenibacillus thermoaerophilus]
MSVIVVYDLEFAMSQHRRQPSDIMEIGAVKVVKGENGWTLGDTFQTLVRPVQKMTVSSDVRQLTGITLDELAKAPSLRDSLEAFRRWLSADPAAEYLAAWGPDDKWMLLTQCRKENIPYDWIRNHNDLQKPISRMMGLPGNKKAGLARALEWAGLTAEGRAHRALDDAINTARLALSRIGELEFERNEPDEDLVYATKVVYSSADDSSEEDDPAASSPFAGLAALFGTQNRG